MLAISSFSYQRYVFYRARRDSFLERRALARNRERALARNAPGMLNSFIIAAAAGKARRRYFAKVWQRVASCGYAYLGRKGGVLMNHRKRAQYFSRTRLFHYFAMRCGVALIGVGVLGRAMACGAPLTYDVGVTLAPPGLPPNYVVTGTITTNGTLGSLRPSDFISWSITVDGPRPYVFQPGNPGASIAPEAVYASLTTLETSGHFGSFWLYAKENKFPNCSDCRENLGWRGFAGDVIYFSYDSADFDPAIEHAVANLGTYYRATIATRIPEPFGFATLLIGIGILASLWRER
jgi:hypothetical protein